MPLAQTLVTASPTTRLCECVVTDCCQVRLATFSQHHVDGMDLALSPLAAMKLAYPQVKVRQDRGCGDR